MTSIEKPTDAKGGAPPSTEPPVTSIPDFDEPTDDEPQKPMMDDPAQLQDDDNRVWFSFSHFRTMRILLTISEALGGL